LEEAKAIFQTGSKTAQYGFYYDSANRLTNSQTPTQKATLYTYEGRNLVKDIQQPSGEHTSLIFDAANRLVSSTDSIGSITNSYDAVGHLQTTSENGYTLAWQYDALGRPTNYTDVFSNTISYAYDTVGNLTNLTYPGGKTVSYSYDAANRLTQVRDWDARITSYVYDDANRPRYITNANGTVVNRLYDLAGRLTQETDATSVSTIICQVNYGYDAANQIIGETNQPATTLYQPSTIEMSFDADDALATYNGLTVSNDLNGNMVWGPLTNGFSSYSFDARNRLLSAGGLSYRYDPAGNRVAITNGTTVIQFVINPNAALSQTLMRIQNGVTNYYVYGLGLLYEITSLGGTNQVLSYHYDYRGSTVAITDTAGNVTDRVSYSPYGCVVSRLGNTDTPFLFNGSYGVMTEANGLIQMRARFYNTMSCRFINADPMGLEAGLNHYAYASGNPVSLNDPFGLCTESSVGKATSDLIGDLLGLAGDVAERVQFYYGSKAINGFNPINGEYALNRSGNMRGMVKSAKDMRLFKTFGAVATVFERLDIAWGLHEELERRDRKFINNNPNYLGAESSETVAASVRLLAKRLVGLSFTAQRVADFMGAGGKQEKQITQEQELWNSNINKFTGRNVYDLVTGLLDKSFNEE
jgi:RHS repeat-associated protein